MSERFEIEFDDAEERSMKAYIKNFYYQRMREQRDQAREMAARLEEEIEQLRNGGQA